MPSASPRPCTHPGCGVLVQGGARCQRHQVQRQTEDQTRRGTASQRGYGAKWRAARADWLREHPLCAEHERQGGLMVATEVDHIVPHRGDQSLFWSRSNWQSLCKSCHSIKTATEDGGFGR